MILLDTNVISELMRPTPDPGVLAWIDGLGSESGVLNGKPYAESGREVVDGQQPAHGALRLGAAGGALRPQA